MNQRLKDILAEKEREPLKYKASGYQYFEEFLPLILAHSPEDPVVKVEATKVERKVEPEVVRTEIPKRGYKR